MTRYHDTLPWGVVNHILILIGFDTETDRICVKKCLAVAVSGRVRKPVLITSTDCSLVVRGTEMY